MTKDRESNRRARRILTLLLILVGLWVIAWGSASVMAPRLVGIAIRQMENFGIGLSEVSFSAIRISPVLNGVGLVDFTARVDLNPRDNIRLQSRLELERADVRLDNLFALRGYVRVSGLELRLDASDMPRSLPFNRFTNAEFMAGDLPLMQPRRMAQEIRRKLNELFLDNQAVGDVQFSGDVEIVIDDEKLIANLYTEREGAVFRLRFSEPDIQAISDRKGMGLAPEQVEIVSIYPLRVPVIMVLTDRALDLAKRHEPEDIWLRDAHRHVTWSYLLTERFGPGFATKVTDAQEMRPGNTPNERTMDLHNNAIGRRLFAKGIALHEIPQYVREDPLIIRHPDEVDSFEVQHLIR